MTDRTTLLRRHADPNLRLLPLQRGHQGRRFDAQERACPRCGCDALGKLLAAEEYAGFLARRDEGPVLDEEERYAQRSLTRAHPQWDRDGVATSRWRTPSGFLLRLSRGERIHWINEGVQPTTREREQDKDGSRLLHDKARGYLLCGGCGNQLTFPETDTPGGGNKAKGAKGKRDVYGHQEQCPQRGQRPRPQALHTMGTAEVLRLLVALPGGEGRDAERDAKVWGLSLGFALRMGMRHVYMLDGPEIDFELEGPWPVLDGAGGRRMALSFIDPSLGGSGYMQRIAGELHLVAARALQHLAHPRCQTACYRCLKSYQNQRFHSLLEWPRALADLQQLASAAPLAQRDDNEEVSAVPVGLTGGAGLG